LTKEGSKGLASAQLAYHKDRLTYPVKRVGPKASGQWERISWDEALDTIVAKSAHQPVLDLLHKWFGKLVHGWIV
jgi:anaerobic selenocysteine-containing dehydrogenase